MDALNLIGQGDISQLAFEEIYKIYRNYSQTFAKRPRGERTSITNKATSGVSRVEISNLLSNMKEDIIIHMAT